MKTTSLRSPRAVAAEGKQVLVEPSVTGRVEKDDPPVDRELVELVELVEQFRLV